jgi:hypothetical protein
MYSTNVSRGGFFFPSGDKFLGKDRNTVLRDLFTNKR